MHVNMETPMSYIVSSKQTGLCVYVCVSVTVTVRSNISEAKGDRGLVTIRSL